MGKVILWVTFCSAIAACGGEEVPSCQDAIGNFYGVGCTFIDTTTNPPTETPQVTALNICSQINIDVPDQCMDEFEDWKFCLDGVTSNAQCTSCSQEMDALFACD